MKEFYVLAVLIVGCTAMVADAQWREGGEAVPDTEWSKSDGDLGAMLLVTDDPEGFFERWDHPPSPDYKPTLTTVSTVNRGDTVVAVVVFTGCAANADGNCQSEVDFTVLFPDGTVYEELKDGELWTDKPAPSVPRLQVSMANLGLRIEDDDPFGTYRMIAVVRDNVADRQLKLVQKVEVVE